MRRKYFAAAVFSLPLANAFSLANFQPITSGLIPAGCALSYVRQIANCDNDDISKGCSKDCKRGLKKTGQDVQAACSGLIVNSRSLLGIVQAGGIIDALCVKGGAGSPTTTSVRITTSVNPIPIPNPTTTGRPTVQPTTGIALPSTTLQTAIQPTTQPALPSSTLQTSIQTTLISSSGTQIIIPPTTAILIPTNGASLPPIPSRSSSTTSAAAVTNTVVAGQGGGRSGGGSPFDIVNQNGASYLERNSAITAMMLGAWALVLFGR